MRALARRHAAHSPPPPQSDHDYARQRFNQTRGPPPLGATATLRHSIDAALTSLGAPLAELRSSLREGERLEVTPHLSSSGQLESLSLCLDMPWDDECPLLPPPSYQMNQRDMMVSGLLQPTSNT